jgi:hypothetical protein
MSVASARQDGFVERIAAPATALVMLALQIGANATRDALFLSVFPVTMLPWFVGGAAVVSFPAAVGVGALLARLGPRRLVPAGFAASGALFATEAALLPAEPAASAVLLYLHATVLGAIVISTFWSLLNERFDPYAAKRLFARVAGAATLGAVLGGLGAERIAATLSAWALLIVLAAGSVLCVAGVLVIGRGGEWVPAGRDRDRKAGGWAALVGAPYLRGLAVVAALAAVVGTLCDYVLKADVSAQLTGGAPLIRFFGVFYAATGMVAFLIQAFLAPALINRLRIAGTLGVHPAVVGLAGLLAIVVPSPWRGIVLRSADVTARHSVFRTGYELLFTFLPEATKRSAKATIDVGLDCAGNWLGAAVVFLLTRLVPAHALTAVTAAAIAAAAAEFVATWRLRTGYVRELEQRMAGHGAQLPHVTHYSFNQLTIGLDYSTAELAFDPASDPAAARGDPLAAARATLRSENPARVRMALRRAEHEPRLIDAVVPLLARKELVDDVARALRAHLPGAARQLADALTNPGTAEVVRRRLPLVLRSCASQEALDGLVQGLSDQSFSVRERCARALLQMTGANPALVVPPAIARAAAERELDTGSGDKRSIVHVFDLLALVYDRATMALARAAYEQGGAQARGTALTYLETTLPRPMFVKLEKRMMGQSPPPADTDRTSG